jgi:hypothetical protein
MRRRKKNSVRAKKKKEGRDELCGGGKERSKWAQPNDEGECALCTNNEGNDALSAK